MISKDKLIYNASTPADADSVASFLHATNKLTSTTFDSHEALDVNVLNELPVDLAGIYVVSTNETPDNVGLIAHTRAATPDETNQIFRSTGGAASADEVVAANVHGLDVNAFNMAFNGSTWDRLTATSGALDINIKTIDENASFAIEGNVADDGVDSGNPLKVGTRAIDAALSELSTAGDRADMISDLYRRLYVNDSPNVAMTSGAATVSTTALLVASSSGRRRIFVQNLGNKAIFVGPSGVSTSSGMRIAAGSALEIPLGEHIPIHAVAESGTQDVRYMQLA
jgi:hypothetical protein